MLSITLIVGFVISIFMVLCILYNNRSSGSMDVGMDVDINSEFENKIEMLELMNEAKQNAQKEINNRREKFTALTLTQDAANQYMNELNFLNYWVQNNTGNKGIMKQLDELVKTANATRTKNKKVLVDILTNIYTMQYLDFLNQQNAEAYKVYAKYSNPQNNKYYTQYIDT
jgi:low affinity Fe/Cu permease